VRTHESSDGDGRLEEHPVDVYRGYEDDIEEENE